MAVDDVDLGGVLLAAPLDATALAGDNFHS